MRIRADDPSPATLALVASLALYDAILEFLPIEAGELLVLKWPNDLLLDGAKLSGILLEREGNAVVVGIGVNLASHPDDLDRPVTSLATQNMPPSPDIFLRELAKRFAQWIAAWRNDSFEAVRKAWLAKAHRPGAALILHDPSGEILHGTFDGLTDDGALCLRLADGSVHVMHAGDVFLI